MADEHIGTREEAIARLRAEQEVSARLGAELAEARAENERMDARLDAIHMACCEFIAAEDEDEISAIRRAACERDAARQERDLARVELVQRGMEIDALKAEKKSAVEAFHDATRLRSRIQEARVKAEDERDALRACLPSERVLLMLATAIPHHPLFSQAMRDECTTAIARMSASVRARAAKPETTDEMIARHNKVNARLLAEAIEDSTWDDDAPAQDAPCRCSIEGDGDPECTLCNGTGKVGGGT